MRVNKPLLTAVVLGVIVLFMGLAIDVFGRMAGLWS